MCTCHGGGGDVMEGRGHVMGGLAYATSVECKRGFELIQRVTYSLTKVYCILYIAYYIVYNIGL